MRRDHFCTQVIMIDSIKLWRELGNVRTVNKNHNNKVKDFNIDNLSHLTFFPLLKNFHLAATRQKRLFLFFMLCVLLYPSSAWCCHLSSEPVPAAWHQAPVAPQLLAQRQQKTADGGAELCTTWEQQQQQQRSAQCQPSLDPSSPPSLPAGRSGIKRRQLLLLLPDDMLAKIQKRKKGINPFPFEPNSFAIASVFTS